MGGPLCGYLRNLGDLLLLHGGIFSIPRQISFSRIAPIRSANTLSATFASFERIIKSLKGQVGCVHTNLVGSLSVKRGGSERGQPPPRRPSRHN